MFDLLIVERDLVNIFQSFIRAIALFRRIDFIDQFGGAFISFVVPDAVPVKMVKPGELEV